MARKIRRTNSYRPRKKSVARGARRSNYSARSRRPKSRRSPGAQTVRIVLETNTPTFQAVPSSLSAIPGTQITTGKRSRF